MVGRLHNIDEGDKWKDKNHKGKKQDEREKTAEMKIREYEVFKVK